MDNHFNTPSEVVDLSIQACEGKTKLPLGKMILMGIMAGAFIAFGGATSSTAAHAIENVGVSRIVAGSIFPVGLMLIVFLGGELFTGNCLIIMDVLDRRVTWTELVRDLVIVYFSNLIGALLVDVLIIFSGNLNYSGSLLGAYTIKVAIGKIAVTPIQGITSGILCNVLVCLAVLMATSATDIAGKVWAIFSRFVHLLSVVLNTALPICSIFRQELWQHLIRSTQKKQKRLTALPQISLQA